MSDRDEMVARLSLAMGAGEFEMFFQPQFDAGSGQPTGLESLLRWRHPERGLVPPVVFLAICEDSGLIVPIGHWMLAKAGAYQASLAEAGWPDVTLSVNISEAQFEDDGLVDFLRRLFDNEAAAPASALELEIQESLVMKNPAESVRILSAVRSLGVRVAIDNFGTGYASMATLQRIPADKIKLDRSLVQTVDQDENSAAICRSILSLAHSFKLPVVAEGVERNEQYEWLRANGVDGVQGYLFARPAPFDDMLRGLGALPG
jgi:EAL domain-containing protein (putative c-di-GMP-specific phosphodiesterase class I)